MCAQYTLKTTATDLNEKYGIHIPNTLTSIDERFLPYQIAPVVVKTTASELKLTPMSFSLIPSWSKEPKVKFATHNARIETIMQKPTWQIPFKKQHCLIPMSGFYESVYHGPVAGNTICFGSESNQLLFAAGIFDVWKDQAADKQIFSFSILTTDPTAFISEHGHDRSPLFLNFDNAKSWLDMKDDDQKMIHFLHTSNLKPDLHVAIDRPLKEGWQKRK